MTKNTPDGLRALADVHRAEADLHRLDPSPNARMQFVVQVSEETAVALTQAASDRAALDRVREALTWHPTCDVHPDDDVITCGWKKAVASITWVLRDEQDGETGRSDWVDDAAPLPRPDGSADA